MPVLIGIEATAVQLVSCHLIILGWKLGNTMASQMTHQSVLARNATFRTSPGVSTTFDWARNFSFVVHGRDMPFDVLFLVCSTLAVLERTPEKSGMTC